MNQWLEPVHSARLGRVPSTSRSHQFPKKQPDRQKTYLTEDSSLHFRIGTTRQKAGKSRPYLEIGTADAPGSLQHITPKRGGHTVTDPSSPAAEHFSPQAGMCWRDEKAVSGTIQNPLCCSCSYRHPEMSCPVLNTPKYHKYLH